MAKKIFTWCIVVFLFVAILCIIWVNLPFTIRYRPDISSGNKIVKNIPQYTTTKGSLPKENDWKTFEQLGFPEEGSGTYIQYTKLSETDFELAYIVGFHGPYLTY